ncbi:MAG: hypothetical protein HY075_05330 [Deltaproteobacteria bacterium]|nr:hypothetical protein [Deltaproteobacteria bacterium]
MRLAFRRVVTAVAFCLALGVVENTACPNAEASYGVNDALSTIGISAGIGAVMGLSTIAFYDSPTKHLSNTLMGAGAGLIVGLGVAAYLLSKDAENDEINPEEVLPPENKPDGTGKNPDKAPAKSQKSGGGAYLRKPGKAVLAMASVPATLAMRDASNWAIAVRVLELRF